MTLRSRIFVACALVLCARAAAAQDKPDWTRPGPAAAPQARQQKPDDPFSKYLYPPELVFGHAEEIKLTDVQRNLIQTAVLAAQVKFLTLQMDLVKQTYAITAALSPAKVDSAKVLQQVDAVLTAEREVKRQQVALLVQIKNLLTPEQQAQLDKLRKQIPAPAPDR